MQRINRYILQQLLILFGFFALVLVLIYWINRAVRLFDQLIADRQSAWVFLEFTALSLPSIIALILPIAAFAAAVYMTNKLSSDSELAILQATGHSGFRIMRPFIVFGVLVMLMQAALQHYLLPQSVTMLQVRQAELAQNATARLLTEGQFMSPSDGVTLYIKSITPEGELIDIFLTETQDDASNIAYSSRRAYLVKSDTGPKLVLIDGLIQQQADRNGRLNVTKFNDFVIDIGQYLKPITVPKQRISTTPTHELLANPTDMSFNVRFEIIERFVKSAAPLFTILLGVSTLLAGAFSRFGIWQRIIYAVVLLILVKVVEGLVIDQIRSTKGQLWMFAIPYGGAVLIMVQQIMLRDRPWIKAAKVGRAS
ncbi:MAG: LPS export ABC transporter permease LptF [Planktomarina sp.]